MVDLGTLLRKSEKRILTLHPVLQTKAFELIKRAYKEGIYVDVCQATRTMEEQSELYAQGRTKPGNVVTNARAGESFHNYGLSFDFCLYTDDLSDVTWDIDDKWMRVVEIGESLGLSSGARWAGFKDYPHFECTFGLSISDLQHGAQIPDQEEKKETEEVIVKFDATTVVTCGDKTVGGLILDGTTFVPIREVAELLGKEVVWDDATKSVTIK